MRKLLKLAEIPRSTFYYHLKNLKKEDKYKIEKDEILSIFHENKGRYGYRRITLEMRNRGYIIKSQDSCNTNENNGITKHSKTKKKI